MSGHTPGPWTLVHDEPYEMSIEANGKRVPGLDLWLDDACFDTNGERIANGKLAAQAPALAEKLSALLRDLDALADAPLLAKTNHIRHECRMVLRAAGELP